MGVAHNGGSWRNFVRRAQATTADGWYAVRDGAEKVGAMVSAANEQRRLRQSCQDLVEEIHVQMAVLGELFYDRHRGRLTDRESIHKLLEYVDGLYADLDRQRAQLKKFKGVLICPACGAENPPESFYCGRCGRSLDVETV